jgi:hypothetical protein
MKKLKSRQGRHDLDTQTTPPLAHNIQGFAALGFIEGDTKPRQSRHKLAPVEKKKEKKEKKHKKEEKEKEIKKEKNLI